MRVAACLLAFASSTLAYSVLSPNADKGWTNQGGQPLVWTRVDTDPQNFTAVLTNQQISGFTPQILAALVDGTLGNTTLNPPSGGWPSGPGFRVNLVVNDTQLNSILAQSGVFLINATTASASVTGSLNTGTPFAPASTPVSPNPTATGADASNTDPIVLPTKNAALSSTAMNGGLLGLVASLLGLVLA